MKPYYEDASVTLYKGDCRTVLLDLDLARVGVVIADPPYGDTSLEWDQWPGGWVDTIADLTRQSASLWCFGSMRMFLDKRFEFGDWKLAQDLVWEKHNGSSFLADRFKRVHEHVLQWYRGEWSSIWKNPVTTPDAVKKQVRKKGRPAHTGHIDATPYVSEDGGPRLARSVLHVRSCHGYAIHPTQKPQGVLEPLLRYSLLPGGTVLDPFAGSGSTLRAAKDIGCRAIGIEAREDYCDRAAEWLSQGSLFEVGA